MPRSSTLLVAAIAALASLFALPAMATAPRGWYRAVTVKYVYAGTTGGRAAVAINETVNAGTCASQEFTLDVDSEYFPYMFAILMNAYNRGSAINIYTDGECTTNGLHATDVSVGPMP
jgi:hypothetical protein